MPRVKGGVTTRARKKKVFKRAKGYWGNKKNQFTEANEQVRRSMRYATRDRRTKKREFRGLWIVRINAAARGNGLSYSQFINGLKSAEITIDRKVLAEIAVTDEKAFTEIAAIAKQALAA
ncbi:50S ribosomal protein L20 [bacterium]|nr:50S ribosomal protein L20 [bacterium]